LGRALMASEESEPWNKTEVFPGTRERDMGHNKGLGLENSQQPMLVIAIMKT